MSRALSSLLFLLASSCAAEIPHWTAPDLSAEGGCSLQLECSGDDRDCIERSASAYQYCALDRIRQTSEGKAARFEFDELARVALSRNSRCQVASAEARGAIAKRVIELVPAIVAEMNQVANDGRVDLAARRAELVLTVLRTFDQAPMDEVAAVIDRARAFHQAEAERLAQSFPAASAYHACSDYGRNCPRSSVVSTLTPELQRVGDADAQALGLWVVKQGPPECSAVLERLPPSESGPPPFALTSSPARFDLFQCGALPVEKVPTMFVCGNQTANATVSIERYAIEGAIRIGAESFPFKRVFEQQRTDRPLTGCYNVPTAAFATAEDAALFTLRDQGWAHVYAHFEPRADRLLLVAMRAARDGDQDRADAAYSILLAGSLGHQHQALADRWFDRRFGSETTQLPSYAEGIDGGGVVNSELGLATSWRWSPPSCY